MAFVRSSGILDLFSRESLSALGEIYFKIERINQIFDRPMVLSGMDDFVSGSVNKLNELIENIDGILDNL